MVKRREIFLTISLLAVATSIEAINYCEICTNHTMCNYPEFGPKCLNMVTHSINNDELKRHIVEEHNKFRSIVAQGQEVRGVPGPQPAAANMKKMIWDDELASVAQRWANQCIFAHDSCRNVDRFLVGQNIFYWSSTYRNGKVPDNENVDMQRAAWTKAVTAWYDEVAKFNPQHVEPFQFSVETGHYTALVWSDSDKIGCGFVTFLGPDNGWYSKHFVCNYGPAGNRLGSALYRVGPAGTQCLQQDTGYPALCAS